LYPWRPVGRETLENKIITKVVLDRVEDKVEIRSSNRAIKVHNSRRLPLTLLNSLKMLLRVLQISHLRQTGVSLNRDQLQIRSHKISQLPKIHQNKILVSKVKTKTNLPIIRETIRRKVLEKIKTMLRIRINSRISRNKEERRKDNRMQTQLLLLNNHLIHLLKMMLLFQCNQMLRKHSLM